MIDDSSIVVSSPNGGGEPLNYYSPSGTTLTFATGIYNTIDYYSISYNYATNSLTSESIFSDSGDGTATNLSSQ